ncbi:carbon-nitrogen family hydrolase [bacterium]|nr:carbon-nitrogen family hydrolase [bacterium]MBU0899895.1 carbon-nitrogen family hydrolase [bacterium]MBU1152465.1 carbon-nitrogen family hydrolase [bacterium]
MSNLTIAIVQMKVKIGKKEENIKEAGKFLEACKDHNPNLICFPELFTTGYSLENIEELSEDIDGSSLKYIAKEAQRLNCYILAGSIAEKSSGRIYNTSFLVNNLGQIVSKYRKINLFPPFKEDLYFSPGERISLSKVKIKDQEAAIIGVLICYDLRFPDLFQRLSKIGAQIIFIPSQFPNPRLIDWETLLKTRAIENQVYVVGINRVGEDRERSYFGHSMVVDPWGKVINNAFEEERILISKIDLSNLSKIKR